MRDCQRKSRRKTFSGQQSGFPENGRTSAVGTESVSGVLEDRVMEKKRRQQLASTVVSYVIVGAVFTLILMYTWHLVEICRTNSYFRLPD
jgi:hypothetical protein